MSLTKFGKKLLCFLALVAFGFAIVACQQGTVTEPSEAKQTAEEHVDDIYNKLFWDDSAYIDITSNLSLATKTMYEDTVVSWSSSHADIIATDGVVSRPKHDHEEAVSVDPSNPDEEGKHVSVTLRATIKATYEEEGEAKEVVKYKEFVFTVLCLPNVQTTTIAQAKADAFNYIFEEKGLDKKLTTNDNTVIYNVEITGVVVAKLNANGAGQFFVHDGTDGIYVYSNKTEVQIGDVVHVVGGVYCYYGNLQVGKDITVTVLEETMEAPAHKEITIEEWNTQDSKESQIGYFGGRLFKVHAKLESYESDGNTNYKLIDLYTNTYVQIYYKSYNLEQLEVLKQYDGKYVYVTGTSYDRDSRTNISRMIWDGYIEEAPAPSLSDDQKLVQAAGRVETLAGSYVAGSLLELPVADEEFGATITWSIPADAPYANGKFALVDVATDFVATAVVAVNGKEQTVEVKFTVNPIQSVTVAQAVALEVGSTVKLTGTIEVIFGSKGNYYLKDASGSLLVYVGTSNGIEVNGSTVTVKAGDKVTLIGETAVFNGCPQIGKIVSYESHEAATWEMSVPQEVSVADIKAYTLENAPYGEYLMVKGTLVKSGNYYYLADGEQQISLYNSNVVEKLAAVADTDTQVTLFVYFYGFQKVDYTGDTRVIFNGREGEYFIGDEPVVLPSERTYKTIGEAKALATSAGVEVTLRGVVTFVGPYSEKYGNFGALIADATDGLYLYRVSGTDAHAKLVVGDEVELTGLMKVYNGLYELCNLKADNITVISSGNVVETVPMSNDIADQSKVVELTGAVWNGKAFEKDGVTYAYFYSSTMLLEEPTLVSGATYNVKGWLNWYNGAQISPLEAPVLAGDAPAHEHVACPICQLCTAADCDGTAEEKCPGHEVTPPTAGVVEGQAYVIGAANSKGTLYFNGTVSSGRFNGVYVKEQATKVYVEAVDGNFRIYFTDASDVKQYVVMGDKSAGGSFTTDSAAASIFEWNADKNTLAVAEDSNNRAFGVAADSTYDNFSCYDLTGSYNWGQFEAVDGTVTPEPSHEHVACPICQLCTAADCDGTAEEKCPGHEVTPVIEEITIAEFLAKPVDATVWYKLTGIMTNIVNTTYGNFTLVDQNDSSVSIYVYGLTATQVTSNDKSFSTLGLEEYDVVTFIGVRAEYKGSAQVGGPAYYVSHVEGVKPAHEHVACPICQLCTADDCDGTAEEKCAGHAPVVNNSLKITFDDVTKRTELDNNHQTWVENGVTVTVNKNTSTSNINGNYLNPVRVYKSHELVVSCEQAFSKVVITVYYNNGATTYIDALAKTTAPAGATMTNVDAEFTLVFAENVNSFSMVMDNAQVRIVSIEVYPAA